MLNQCHCDAAVVMNFCYLDLGQLGEIIQIWKVWKRSKTGDSMWRHSVVGCHWFVWATNFQNLTTSPVCFRNFKTFLELQVIYELYTDVFQELFVDMFQVAVEGNIGSGKYLDLCQLGHIIHIWKVWSRSQDRR